MPFSIGFASTGDDSVNADTGAEVGRNIQIKLAGQSVALILDVKSKVHALSSVRKMPMVKEKTYLFCSTD